MQWNSIFILGYIALVCYLLSPIFKLPRHSILSSQFGEVLNLILYLSQMQFAGAITLVLSIVRGGTALFGSDVLLKRVLIINVVLLWAILLFRMEHLHDLLLACAGTSLACAQLNRDHFWNFRLFCLVSQSLWIAHASIIGMTPMVLSCVAMMTINVAMTIYHQRHALFPRQYVLAT